jgi:uncharacterized membrane protein (UPF0127 family)
MDFAGRFAADVRLRRGGQFAERASDDAMESDHGMIFVFPDCQNRSFWMHHTRFPLDIIFADDHDKVVSTQSMKAYDESSTYSKGPAKYAIELNVGEAASCGAKPGDTLQIPPAVATVKAN